MGEIIVKHSMEQNSPAPPATLLLLPGLDGTGATSGAFVDHLADRLHPIQITFPPNLALSRADLARRVLADWPTLGPVIVLGESYSTAIAVKVAAVRPPRLVGVVLVTPTFTAPPRLPFRLPSPGRG